MFEEHIVMITGANSGFGLETAKNFLAAGATVVGIDRRFRGTEVLGKRFYQVQCDVTDPEQISNIVSYVDQNFGRLDVLFTNAGKAYMDTIESLSNKKMDQCYELHLKHHVTFIRAFLPLLKKSIYDPNIICNSSNAGLHVTPEEQSYGMMKSAVLHMVRSCASYFNGIRINAICPGIVRTRLLASSLFDMLEQSETIQSIPMHRIGKVEEVADTVLFLASEEARYINGAIITIDGGFLLGQSTADIL